MAQGKVVGNENLINLDLDFGTQLVKDAKNDFLRSRLNRNVGMKKLWKNAKELGLVASRKDAVAPAFTTDEFKEHTTYRITDDNNRETNILPKNDQISHSNSQRTNDRRLFAFRNVNELEVYKSIGSVNGHPS